MPSMEFSEELKEAIARAKGKGYFLIKMEDGEINYIPDCFDIVKQTKDRITLKVRRPEIPTPEKQKLVGEIVRKIEPELKSSIVDAVAQSLREKPLGELLAMAEAKEFKVQRRRGCLWLITDKTEHVL